MLRTIALSLLVACGPMYGPPPQQQQQAPSLEQGMQVAGPRKGDPPSEDSPILASRGRASDRSSGPPGGGADLWEQGAPSAGTPDDPYSTPAAPPPARPGPPPLSGGGGKLAADSRALLDAHNRVRAKHCAGPLAWSERLEQVAQQWVSTLVNKGCVLGHSNGTFGENLAAGTIGALDGESVVAMWYDEGKQYSFQRGGFSMNTGHFTQVVWRTTTQVGCAKAQCKGNDIYVCEYNPPGNVESEFRQNVLPPGCK